MEQARRQDKGRPHHATGPSAEELGAADRQGSTFGPGEPEREVAQVRDDRPVAEDDLRGRHVASSVRAGAARPARIQPDHPHRQV